MLNTDGIMSKTQNEEIRLDLLWAFKTFLTFWMLSRALFHWKENRYLVERSSLERPKRENVWIL